MPRAPKWFPAWRHLWVRASIRTVGVLFAAIVAEIHQQVYGYGRTIVLVLSLTVIWLFAAMFRNYMDRRQ